MSEIEKFLSQKDMKSALKECEKNQNSFLQTVFERIYNSIPLVKKTEIKVKLLASWCDALTIRELWNKMTKGNYTWNEITLVLNEPVDYYIIINKPFSPTDFYDPKRTIVFQMEPFMEKDKSWGQWSEPKHFLKVFKHKTDYNNNEWHLSLTWGNLKTNNIIKNDKLNNIISTVLSNKYSDIGHVKRIDFVKFLEKKGVEVHVYGENRFQWKKYKGELPPYKKDLALLPYKYNFNAENNPISNYYTEKLVDGILTESLTFYWGCPNIRELIDPRAYVELSLSNFEKDFETIQKAINEDWYNQRLPFIKKEKYRILNELQFFPRLEKFLNELKG
jgi:hypothetical protein